MIPDNKPFEILLSGIFDRRHLAVHWSNEQRTTSPEIERSIEEAWNTRQVDAQQRGRILYPGRLCRLIDCRIQDDNLHLTLGATDFRELVGTNLSHPEWFRNLGPTYLSNALGVHAVVSSSDSKLLIYKRSSLVAEYPNFYDVCGGHVEPDFDFVKGKPDPFAAIVREIQEELSVAPDEIEKIVCLGLVRNTKTFKPDLIFSIRTNRTSSAFLETPLDDEHVEIRAIEDDVESINRFLEEYSGRIAPAGEACLILHILPYASGNAK